MEIQAQGGFWFATRTDVPFGHPLFKGFGDPETIIHEQRRALGHKVFCLPARIVSCVHRFLRVRHNDYHSVMPETAFRNHWIGVQSLRVHLMKEAVAAGFNEPTEWLIASWIDAMPQFKDRILQAAASAAEEYFTWEEQQRAAQKAHQAKQQEKAAASQHAVKFGEIAKMKAWGDGESISGPGSSYDATAIIREEIPKLMVELSATRLLDVPCGDHHWMSQLLHAHPEIKYLGGDVVPEIVEANKKRFGDKFKTVNLLTDELPEADIVLVRDALVHMPHADVKTALANIKASGSKWLLATTFPGRKNRDIELGQWHPMDLSDPIFGIGQPEKLINEGCKEGGGQFKDKSLGLWRLQ
jgi:hypothetical protein